MATIFIVIAIATLRALARANRRSADFRGELSMLTREPACRAAVAAGDTGRPSPPWRGWCLW